MSVLNAQARRATPLQIDPAMPDLADAACAGTDPALWFTDAPQRPLDMDPQARWVEPGLVRWIRIRRMRQALAICSACPALTRCRDFTIEHPEMSAHGIWAGLTARQRKAQRCVVCDDPAPYTGDRPRLYCTPACAQRAYRRRRKVGA